MSESVFTVYAIEARITFHRRDVMLGVVTVSGVARGQTHSYTLTGMRHPQIGDLYTITDDGVRAVPKGT